MFTFRYLGHFDLQTPFIKVSEYDPAVPNVTRPLPKAVFNELLTNFPADRAALKWCYGSIMSFLSLPEEYHPFERALIEDGGCAALNMRLEVIRQPGNVAVPLAEEVWSEVDYLTGPKKYEMRWCDEFYERLVWSENSSQQPPPSLQGQLLSAATDLEYEFYSGGQRLEGAIDVFEAYGEFALLHLCDGTFNAEAATLSRRAVAGFNGWMASRESEGFQVSNDLEAMVLLAYHWCRLHPRILSPASVMWDNPAGPDTAADGEA